MRINKKFILMSLAVAAIGISACQKKEVKTEVPTSTESSAGVEVKEIEKPKSYGKATLGKYKGIKLSIMDTAVSDEEVDEKISEILLANPDKEEITDRAVKDGDTVNIDYVGTIDGVAFEGGTAQGQDLTIGSGAYIPGFEEGLIGVKKGKTKDVNVKFPENYQSTELAGKNAVFSVTVNSIFVEKPAELTDEWVKEYTAGGQKTVAEFKEAKKTEIEREKKLVSDSTAQKSAVEAVVKDAKINVNEDAVEYEYNEWIKQFTKAAEAYQMNFESFASMYGMTAEAMQTELRKEASEFVKRIVVVDEIIKKEKFDITQEDYNTFADLQGTSIDILKATYDELTIERAVRDMKVAQFIVDNADKTVQQSMEGLEFETEAKQ